MDSIDRQMFEGAKTPQSGHSIKFTLSEGYPHPIAEFVCHEPRAALCRMACSQGCEYITDACRSEHEWHDLYECNLKTWMEEGDVSAFELYCGPTTELRSGPVTFTWQGDYYLWSYA